MSHDAMSTWNKRLRASSYTVCCIVVGGQYMAHGNHSLDPAVYDNLRLELRRGSLTVAVLAALRVEQYGYTLRKMLEDKGLSVEEGTLYPLLRRLETQGLLTSEWREEDKR